MRIPEPTLKESQTVSPSLEEDCDELSLALSAEAEAAAANHWLRVCLPSAGAAQEPRMDQT